MGYRLFFAPAQGSQILRALNNVIMRDLGALILVAGKISPSRVSKAEVL